MKNFFAENLRFLRKINNLTQEDLAMVMNKRHTTIGNWEKKVSKPNIEELIDLANYFNLDVNTILLKDISSSQDSVRQVKKKNIEPEIEMHVPVANNNNNSINNNSDFTNELIESMKVSIQALQQVVAAKTFEIDFLRKNAVV